MLLALLETSNGLGDSMAPWANLTAVAAIIGAFIWWITKGYPDQQKREDIKFQAQEDRHTKNFQAQEDRFAKERNAQEKRHSEWFERIMMDADSNRKTSIDTSRAVSDSKAKIDEIHNVVVRGERPWQPPKT